MNLKEMIFGGNVRPGGDSGAYRDSIQAWIPIKNIMGGVVITKDNRFVKILELLPVNVYLKSANDRQNIVSSFAAYLKIAPNDLQMVARTLPADTQAYVEQMRRFAEQEENEDCREMIEDNIQEIGYGIASDAMRHRFFLVFQYEAMPLNIVQGILGHSSIETTRKYLHKNTDIEREAITSMTDYLSSDKLENAPRLNGTKKRAKFAGIPLPDFSQQEKAKANQVS